MKKLLIKKVSLVILILAGSGFIMPQNIQAHCQLPCGIYDDYARIQSMREDAATIEKSVEMIVELSGKQDAQSQNQLIRWVVNKEKHAQNIIDTISTYFLTQRVKSSQNNYVERLIKHHTVIVAAMEVKQNVDLKYVKKLQKSIEEIAPYYPEHNH